MMDYRATPYTIDDWQNVVALVGDSPFKPFAGHARWDETGLTRLCLARVANRLSSPHATTWIARIGADVCGFVTTGVLPWDSEQIGMAAARLDFLIARGNYAEQYAVKSALMDAVLEHCARAGIQHLVARVDASDLSSLHVLEQGGFVALDGILTFARGTDSLICDAVNQDMCIRLATVADSEAVADLARHAYVYDRFHSDPVIPTERANELHAAWLHNSCAGSAADAVVLAESKRGLLGFVTCKLHRDTKESLGTTIGTIVLVATSAEARQTGVGRAMTLASLEWFRNQGVAIVEVGTQLRNIPASRLYESCGFRLVGSGMSLRMLL